VSYLEYIDKLSELKQTIVGYGDALSALGNLFVLLGKFALTTIVVVALATIIAVVVDWFIEKLMNGMSRLLKESIGINLDVLLMFTVMVGILGSFAISTSIGFISTPSNQTSDKSISHSDSLVLLHNDLVNWNDSDFDELWNATVKYKLTKSDDDEYSEVVKVIKEVKLDRDKLKE
jgi:predicted PurR-regulated permease PerM